MDIENMFTEQKWNILKSLSHKKYSPLQLAEKSNTSIANISQQLRLLEAAELVKKEKVQNRDRGKPRTLFSLSCDHAYIVSTMQSFAKKKLLKLDEHDKFMLRIMHLENQDLHYYLSKWYWKVEDYLPSLNAIALNPHKDPLQVYLVGEKAAEVAKKLKSIQIKKPGSDSKEISAKAVSKADLNKQFEKESLEIIHDPQAVFNKTE